MKKNILFMVIMMVAFCNLMAQNIREVEAKGIGVGREDALQDALRNAVSSAAGVIIKSETTVENFITIQDAINSRTSGYVASYKVIKEGAKSGNYEMDVLAQVSLDPIKADVNLLAQAVGGIRFLVMFDERTLAKEDIPLFEFASERINQFLSERKYRYIDRRRFESLRREASNLMQASDTNELTYAQQLGLMGDAQFIIFLKAINRSTRSEAFDTRTSSRVVVEAKAFDNCTGEGLGTVILESGWRNTKEADQTLRDGVNEAVSKDFNKLLNTFTSYIGDWANNGIPYELRFYASGTFRDFRDLRTKIREDKLFGGQMEMTSVNNYTKLNCTFRKQPDNLADKILDYCDQVPSFAAKEMDVKLIYGRQISFAPRTVVVPELKIPNVPAAESVKEEPAQQSPSNTKPKK